MINPLQELRNIVHGTIRIVLRTVRGEALKPKWLWIEVTDQCNSRCAQCNIWRNDPTKNMLTPEEIKKTLRDPLFKDVKIILNAGGEPTLRNDLEEIILAEHEAIPGAEIMIGTNALLAERIIDVVKAAIENNIKMHVGISLDGIGDDHDAIRGVKGNFKKVDFLAKELLALSQKHKTEFPVFGFTLIDRTLPLLKDVEKYSKELGVGFLAQWYNQSPFFNNENKDLVKDKMAMISAIKKYPSTLLNETGIRWLKGKPIKYQCYAMHTFCMLHCNGDISPCLGHWNESAGNVRESSPTQIWKSDKASKVRKIVMNCNGCLNSCGVVWSAESGYYPNLIFRIKRRMLNMFSRGKKPKSANYQDVIL